jgi:hypothetical protein
MKNPFESIINDAQSTWTAKFSDARVVDLFRQLRVWAEVHNADPGKCRAMAMTVAVSDLIDIMAFCVRPEDLETEIATIVEHIRMGHPLLKQKWEEQLGAKAEPKPAWPEFELKMTCPFCGAGHEVAGIAEADGQHPKDGDASMCIKCGEVGIFAFDQEGNLRQPTIQELNDIADDPGIAKMKKAWKATMELEQVGTPNPKTPWKGPVQ